MKVEIWSDIACPFCYIGKRRFEAALAEFPHKDEVEVHYHSFQLDPAAPKNPEQDVYEMVGKKYGLDREKVITMHADLVAQGKSAGVDLNFEHSIPTNSMDAHRLLHFAGQHGKKPEVFELLYKAYFTDAKHIGDHAVLLEIAREAGLPSEEAAEVLNSDRFVEEVQAEGEEASALGAKGVPFYVIDRKYGVSGAQPSDYFLGVLQQVWEESRS